VYFRSEAANFEAEATGFYRLEFQGRHQPQILAINPSRPQGEFHNPMVPAVAASESEATANAGGASR